MTDHGEVVGDEQVGDAGALLDLQEQASTRAWVDRSSAETGSSQTISLGAERERPGDRDPLPLAAGNSRGSRPTGVRRAGPTWSSSSRTRSAASAFGTFVTVSGSVRICSIVIDGFSDVYGSWNTT